MDLKIIYSNLVPKAKELATMSTTGTQNIDFSRSKLANFLSETFYGKLYGNPCELNNYVLSGKKNIYSSNNLLNNESAISEYESDIYCDFPNGNPKIKLDLNKTITSDGVTIYFEMGEKCFPKLISCKWYQSGSVISTKQITNIDSAWYYVENHVEDFDAFEVECIKTSIPNVRFRLANINFGKEFILDNESAKNVSILQEIDMSSSTLSANELRFDFYNEEYGFNLQERERLKVLIDEDLNGIYFVDKFERKSVNLYSVVAYDYVGLLEKYSTNGFMLDNTLDELSGEFRRSTLGALMTRYFEDDGIPVYIEDGLDEIMVWGYCPNTNKRELLRMLCFATGTYADTSWSDGIKIRSLLESPSRHIARDEIMEGQYTITSDKISQANVEYYKYTRRPTAPTTIYRFDPNNSGDQLNNQIRVTFDQPLFNIQFMDYNAVDYNAATGMGTIDEYDSSYQANSLLATPIATNACLKGFTYYNTASTCSAIITVDGKENIVNYSGCGLMNPLSATVRMENQSSQTNGRISLKDYLKRNKTIREKFDLLYDNGGEKLITRLGDYVSNEMDFEKTEQGEIISRNGHIVKTYFNVWGGSRLVADVEILEDFEE